MLISPFMWCVIIYLSIGTYIMMEAIIEGCSESWLPVPLKVLAGIVSICIWPLIFII